MRVLHVNSGFAGVPVLARAQRSLGLEADVATYNPRCINNIEYDYYLHTSARRRDIPARLFRFWNIARRYDVLHFHYHSALPARLHYADFILWRLMGKKIVMHYRGDDIRNHPHAVPRRLAHAILVSTPDLLEWEPDALWVPPVRANNSFVGLEAHNGPLRIAHAPSDREVKGTYLVIAAVKALQSEGMSVCLDLVEKATFAETMDRYRAADMVVDQLKVGWYGGVSIEAMSLGKPVMCYVRHDLEKLLRPYTLWNTDKYNIKRDIRLLADSPDLRRRLSHGGYEHYCRTHDPVLIAGKLKQIYQSL
jgi:hypothetical protein